MERNGEVIPIKLFSIALTGKKNSDILLQEEILVWAMFFRKKIKVMMINIGSRER